MNGQPAREDLSVAEFLGRAAMPSLEPDAATAGKRLREALRQGGRFVAMIGDSDREKTAIVAALVADPDLRAVYVANPLVARLTLPRILLQIGGEDMGTSPDDATAFVQSLVAQQGGERRLVLLINDAESLDPSALLWLQDLPAMADPESLILSIVFVASPAFRTLLEDERLARLRDALLEVAVEIPPTVVHMLPIEDLLAPLVMPRSQITVTTVPEAGGWTTQRIARVGSRRLLWALGAAFVLAAFVLVAFVVFAAGWHRGPTHPENAPAAPLAEFQPVTAPPPDTAMPADPASASIPPAGETAAQNLPPPAFVPDSAPAALATIPALDRLRQDFEAFLDRAGADTARLSDSQRQAFFDEYLEWLRQTSLGPGQGVTP